MAFFLVFLLFKALLWFMYFYVHSFLKMYNKDQNKSLLLLMFAVITQCSKMKFCTCKPYNKNQPWLWVFAHILSHTLDSTSTDEKMFCFTKSTKVFVSENKLSAKWPTVTHSLPAIFYFKQNKVPISLSIYAFL